MVPIFYLVPILAFHIFSACCTRVNLTQETGEYGEEVTRLYESDDKSLVLKSTVSADGIVRYSIIDKSLLARLARFAPPSLYFQFEESLWFDNCMDWWTNKALVFFTCMVSSFVASVLVVSRKNLTPWHIQNIVKATFLGSFTTAAISKINSKKLKGKPYLSALEMVTNDVVTSFGLVTAFQRILCSDDIDRNYGLLPIFQNLVYASGLIGAARMPFTWRSLVQIALIVYMNMRNPGLSY